MNPLSPRTKLDYRLTDLFRLNATKLKFELTFLSSQQWEGNEIIKFYDQRGGELEETKFVLKIVFCCFTTQRFFHTFSLLFLPSTMSDSIWTFPRKVMKKRRHNEIFWYLRFVSDDDLQQRREFLVKMLVSVNLTAIKERIIVKNSKNKWIKGILRKNLPRSLQQRDKRSSRASSSTRVRNALNVYLFFQLHWLLACSYMRRQRRDSSTFIFTSHSLQKIYASMDDLKVWAASWVFNGSPRDIRAEIWFTHVRHS